MAVFASSDRIVLHFEPLTQQAGGRLARRVVCWPVVFLQAMSIIRIVVSL
jgi:hypothetical protein